MALLKKPRQCRVCREMFQPVRQLQNVCSPECALKAAEISRKKAEAKQAKAERIADMTSRKILREKLKTARDWTREAQIAFNSYIRERDKERLCICCNQPLSSGSVGGGFDCGHYRSVGSAPHLRFDPRNAHAQRKQCNRWGSGRAVDYRLGLIARIGLEAVESLEADQTPRKYSIEDLKAIKAHYKQLLKELQHGR